MSEYPNNLRYSRTHEWFDPETNRVGISSFAVGHLGDVVEVDLSVDEGDIVDAGDEVGTIESVKTASPIYAPVSGKIVGFNEDLSDAPELVNDAPYTDGWILEIEPTSGDDTSDLLDATLYSDHCASEE